SLCSLCCFLCLAALAQAQAQAQAQAHLQLQGQGKGSAADASPRSSAAALKDAAAHMYKIKRQDKYQVQRGIKNEPLRAAPLPMLGGKQQQQQQEELQQSKQPARGAHGLNKKLLSKMGFMKVKAPNSHNRKRLAVESRRHASRDDSHMFIIKLPPNLHYYTSPNAARNALDVAPKSPRQPQQPQQVINGVDDNAQKIASLLAKATPKAALGVLQSEASAATEASALKTNGKKVSFPFSSNGRPGRIYHWNLPVLKQALHKKPHFAHVSSEDRNRLLDIEKIPTWRKPWENETIEKSFTAGGGKSKYKKSLKQKSPTYYAPAQAVNKQSFHKYFAGNGKPKGFYVIKEHQTKPQFYQNIIS
ncbi:hypothetical protein KR222_007598, partial [Zaprionus bogoriensis]